MEQPRGDEGLWEEYRSVIACHICPGHDVVDTVNRLLRKSPWFTHPEGTLQIPRTNLAMAEDSWGLPRLWQLIHAKQITEVEPASTDGAVLTLHCKGSDYLMDGRRRINHWHRNAVVGPHRVLILSA
jgi:hypothetical protein